MNLAPASWIWFPSQRTLANTFVLFRRELTLHAAPSAATGWITADSRYRFTVNGERARWGPAPCDPRSLDVDPVDFVRYLRAGDNVLGVEVLYYGVGEGTWVAGRPGFLCRFDITDADGYTEQIISDDSWQAYLDRAHRPGQYKRWFLRALQEDYDARLHPAGWDMAAFIPDERWLPAMPIACPA
ncbi:MAG TPA: alpha-L-rhamnosidase N-terminal domain-containing protein, partial [Roseiflexaceae bacterium]